MQRLILVFFVGFFVGALASGIYFNDAFKVWFRNRVALVFQTKTERSIDTALWNQPSSMVCLVMGQSNAANYGAGKYTTQSDQVYNFHEGKAYAAQEPLLGADGRGVSVWTRVADGLIQKGQYKRVMIVTVARGSTSVKTWRKGKDWERVTQAVKAVQKAGLRISHVFWVQGETDNADGMEGKTYQTELGKVVAQLRGLSVQAKVFVAVTTYAYTHTHQAWGISPSIQQAQRAIVQQYPGLYPGPFVDSLDKAFYRYQDLHFSPVGLDSLAQRWIACIQ